MDEKYRSIDPYGEENWDDDTPTHIDTGKSFGSSGCCEILSHYGQFNRDYEHIDGNINKMKETCKAKKLESLSKSIVNKKNYVWQYNRHRKNK